MIQVARNFARADLVIVGMITIGLIGAILTIGLEILEKIFVKGK
jgi:NitT/TauT family transport system permease protein/taurine transport system permease protein